jgi:hypothetical protein
MGAVVGGGAGAFGVGTTAGAVVVDVVESGIVGATGLVWEWAISEWTAVGAATRGPGCAESGTNITAPIAAKIKAVRKCEVVVSRSNDGELLFMS